MKKRTKVIIAVGAIALLLGWGIIKSPIMPLVDPPYGVMLPVSL